MHFRSPPQIFPGGCGWGLFTLYLWLRNAKTETARCESGQSLSSRYGCFSAARLKTGSASQGWALPSAGHLGDAPQYPGRWSEGCLLQSCRDSAPFSGGDFVWELIGVPQGVILQRGGDERLSRSTMHLPTAQVAAVRNLQRPGAWRCPSRTIPQTVPPSPCHSRSILSLP